MSFVSRVMSHMGFKKQMEDASEASACGGEVYIKDGQIIGNPYAEFCSTKQTLTDTELAKAYEKVACIATSVDLISNNFQMIEPVIYNDSKREFVEMPSDRKIKNFLKLLRKPNAIDSRSKFFDKAVKNYIVYGVAYFAFTILNNEITSMRVLDNGNVSMFEDVVNNRIGSYLVTNSGGYTGQYEFNGTYYVKDGESSIIIAPFVNPSTEYSYMPASLLLGAGLETLMYWYGCFHNKSLLQNGARPSMVFLIKSLLNPKHREQLRNEIRIKHGGAGNAGSAIIIDGAADKDVKQFSQNNKDMEFSTVLKAAEDAIYKRLGVNWVLGEKVTTKDLQTGREMMYDNTICPLFNAVYNHLFDVCKYFSMGLTDYSVFYLEQDVPALESRFLKKMKDLPSLGIFTIKERRAMYNYQPLGDARDDELTVQTVQVNQTGKDGKENTTTFSGDNKGEGQAASEEDEE